MTNELPVRAPRARDNRLIFLDLETSGLETDKDLILEVGVTVVSDELNYRLAVDCDEADQFIFHRIPQYEEPIETILTRSDDYVRSLHVANGLVADSNRARCEDSRSPALIHIEGQLIHWLTHCHGFVPGSGVLAGSSIHFDRGFVTRHMPTLDKFLHYRMLDVSAIREAYIRWRDNDFSNTWKKIKGPISHRVKGDLTASVEELRYLREKIFGHATRPEDLA